MTQIDHERCSELLLPYERGQLNAAEAFAVEQHIGSCPRCAQERAGLTMLLDGSDAEPLTAAESARLHAALAGEIGGREPAPAAAARTSSWSRLWGWRGGALVGAAAAVLLAVGALVIGPRLGEEDAAEDAATGRGVTEADIVRGPKPVFAAPVVPSPEAISAAEQGGADEAPQEDAATQQAAQLGSDEPFGTAASKARPFARFAAAFDADDVAALQSAYVDDLARKAAVELRAVALERPAAEVLRACAELAIRESPNPLLPAYATYAPVDGVHSLILGFVYSEDGSGPVDRYTIMAWPKGDCDAPPAFASGDIAK